MTVENNNQDQGQQAGAGAGAAAEAVLAAAGAGQEQKPGEQKPGEGQQQNGAFRLEDIPENFRGKTAEETLEKLWGGYKGFRDKEAARGAVPKDMAGYAFTPNEELSGFLGEAKIDDDPAFKAAAEIALKHGVPAKAMAEITEAVTLQSIKAIVGKEWAPQDEFAALAGSKDPAAIEAAKPRIVAAVSFFDNLSERAKLDKATATDIRDFAASATGARLFEALRSLNGPGAASLLPGSGGMQGEAVTRETLRQRQADPRNEPNSADYQPSFRRETDRLYRELFPTK